MKKTFLSVALATACAAGCIGAHAAEPGETTIGGRAFVDLTSIDETSNGTKTDASGIGLDVKRFYFIVGHQFDKTWSVNLTTDFNYVSNDSETQLFIKKAYAEAKFNDKFTLRLGSADTPLLPFLEGIYGYRFIETMVVERIGFESSADWGAHILGTFGNGKAHYAVSAINGNGYKNPSRSQSLDLDTRVDFEPVKGLTLAAFYRTGKRGLDKQSVTTLHTASRTELLAAYSKDKFRVGLELFQADNWNQVLSPLSDSSDGHSLWGTFNVKKNVQLFARVDEAKPSKDLAPALENRYYNLGVIFTPVSRVDLAVVYKQDKVDGGSLKTSNGTIGAATGALQGKHNEIGLWAQVSF
jgi:hypothetical protein